MIAVLRNYARPNFFAILILYSVKVLGLSTEANFLIAMARTLLIIEIDSDAAIPRSVIANAVPEDLSFLLFSIITYYKIET